MKIKATAMSISHRYSRFSFVFVMACVAMYMATNTGTSSVAAVKMLLHQGNKAHISIENKIRSATVAKVNGELVQKQKS